MSLLCITTEINSEIDVQNAQCLDERINDRKELVLAQDIYIERICRPLPNAGAGPISVAQFLARRLLK